MVTVLFLLSNLYVEIIFAILETMYIFILFMLLILVVCAYAIFSIIKNNSQNEENNVKMRNEKNNSFSDGALQEESKFENQTNIAPKKQSALYGVIIGFTAVIAILVFAKIFGVFWSKNYTDCECEKIYNDYVIQMSGYGDDREVNRSGLKDCGKRLLKEMNYDIDIERLDPDYASQYFYEKCKYGFYKEKGARAK